MKQETIQNEVKEELITYCMLSLVSVLWCLFVQKLDLEIMFVDRAC